VVEVVGFAMERLLIGQRVMVQVMKPGEKAGQAQRGTNDIHLGGVESVGKAT